LEAALPVEDEYPGVVVTISDHAPGSKAITGYVDIRIVDRSVLDGPSPPDQALIARLRQEALARHGEQASERVH
jgi:hypothetical protein